MADKNVRYKIENWPLYNKALVDRGNISLWFSEEICTKCKITTSEKKKGKPFKYSDAIIELCLFVKYLYKLTYRMTQGFIQSLLKMLGFDLEIPSYSQICRRAKNLKVKLQRVFQYKGKIDIAIDSTGMKVFGEGEWKVRKHGVGKRRTWRKVHIAVDPLDHEIVAAISTDNSTGDAEVFDKLLNKIEGSVDRCFADGAYDTNDCYQSSFNRNIDLITPPRINATPDEQGYDHLKARNNAISHIENSESSLEIARKEWKISKDYHCRSNSETAMYRLKTIFGDSLTSRNEETQDVEMMVKINILNKMTRYGMPITQVHYA